MDRRAALRKLGVGALAAGAVHLVSSEAMADGGTTTCRPVAPTATPSTLSHVVDTGNSRIRISVSGYGTTTCPGCRGGSTIPVVQFRWDVTPVSGSTPLIVRDGLGGNITGVWTTFTTVYIRTNPPGFPAFIDPSQFQVRVTIRWVCRGARSAAWACRSYVNTITYNPPPASPATGTGWVVSGIGACEPPNPANP